MRPSAFAPADYDRICLSPAGRLACFALDPWILLINASPRAVCAPHPLPCAFNTSELCIHRTAPRPSGFTATTRCITLSHPLLHDTQTPLHSPSGSVQQTAAATSLHAPWRPPSCLPSGSFCVSATRQDTRNTNANPMGLPIPVSARSRHDAAACLPANHLQTIVFVIIHQQLYNVLVCA